MTEINHYENKCVITHDSFYFSGEQSQAFIFSYFVFLSLFLLYSFISLYALLAGFMLAFMVQSPFHIMLYYQRGIGQQYNFHWSLPLGFFTLFCVNFRLFGLSNPKAKDVKLKLNTFRDLHNG